MHNVPADAARRLPESAHLLQGQTLDSRWAEESGRYLLRSVKATNNQGGEVRERVMGTAGEI